MIETRHIETVLRDVLSYAEREDFAGYSKFDALNSRWLKRLSFNSSMLRLVFTQAVMRCPWHVRPLLGVERSRNPKGIALFAMAYLESYRRTGLATDRQRAEECLTWLAANNTIAEHGVGWGYNFDWQSTLFFAPAGTPNAIVTTLCGEAFSKAHRVLGSDDYGELANAAARFLRYDLPTLEDEADELCIAYVPYPVKSIVLNINASAGAMIAKAAQISGDDALRRDAERLIRFVVNRRTDYDAWYYTYPAKNSYIVHDNYHTGGIVDAIYEYGASTGDDQFQDVYLRGLDYYARELFLPDGAPKHMNHSVYPLDIHGAAQGIISFVKAADVDSGYLDLAGRIAEWTVQNLYDADRGFFYYQKGRLLTKRYTLMRWCNAWMAKALADLVSARQRSSGNVPAPHLHGSAARRSNDEVS